MKTILKATILALTSFSSMESPMVAASLIANQSSSTDTTLMANPMLPTPMLLGWAILFTW